MNTDVLFQVISAIGGITVISGSVALFVSKFISSRVIQSHQAKLDTSLETHKNFLIKEADRNRLLLKRQELMFEREYEASTEFHRIFILITPRAWAPDLDWSDAQKEISENFLNHERDLKSFLLKHVSSLSEEVRELIESAIRSANRGSFEVGYDAENGEYHDDIYPNKAVREEVDEFYGYLQKADKRIIVDLREGSLLSEIRQPLSG